MKEFTPLDLQIFSKIKINSFDKDGNTLLINSIIEDEYNIAKFLIKNRANPNIPNKKNYKSPLVYASEMGKNNFVVLLLKQKEIIIQPNSISRAMNEEIKNLISYKLKQLEYDSKIQKLKNNTSFKSGEYIIPLLDEIRKNEHKG